MRNPFYNPVWSAYITSRVKMRMHRHMKQAVQIFVDSVWLTRPIETETVGDGIGDFRLVKHWPRLHIKWAGNYGWK